MVGLGVLERSVLMAHSQVQQWRDEISALALNHASQLFAGLLP